MKGMEIMFQVGQWVLYRNVPGYVEKADEAGNRYLVHLPRVSKDAYWVPAKYIQSNEDVHLYSDDVQELMAVAVKSGDFHWYKELTEKNVTAKDE